MLSWNVFASASAPALRRASCCVGHQIERRLQRQRLGLPFDIEPKRRHRIGKQPVPRASRRLRLISKQLLEFLIELKRLLFQQVIEPWLVVLQRGAS